MFVLLVPALALQRSANRAMKTHILGVEQFIEFIFTPNIWVFIAQLEERCSAEAMGSNPVEALKIFFGLKFANA